MNAIVKHEERQIERYKPPLTKRVKRLLENPSSYNNCPIVGPETARELKEYVNYPEPPLVTKEELVYLLGIAAAGKASRHVSDDESMIAEAFDRPALLKFSYLDLEYAVRRIRGESKWIADASELMKYAGYAANMRNHKRNTAMMLLLKHEREYEPLKELCKPEDVKAILNELKIGDAQ